MDHADHTPIAGRCVISYPPAEAVALASDLLLSARARCGRARKEAGQ